MVEGLYKLFCRSSNNTRLFIIALGIYLMIYIGSILFYDINKEKK